MLSTRMTAALSLLDGSHPMVCCAVTMTSMNMYDGSVVSISLNVLLGGAIATKEKEYSILTCDIDM